MSALDRGANAPLTGASLALRLTAPDRLDVGRDGELYRRLLGEFPNRMRAVGTARIVS